MGDFIPRVELTPIVNDVIWIGLTFLIPLGMILALLFSKKSKFGFYVASFCLITLFLLFFNKGNQPPFTDFYLQLYDLPFVGWMIRSPGKIGLVLAFFITMILSLGTYKLLNRNGGKFTNYFKYIPIVGFIIAISIISWPMFTGDLAGALKNQKPSNEDFMNSIDYSEGDPKIFLYPRDRSLRQDIDNVNYVSDQYSNFIYQKIEEKKDFSKLLEPLSAKYLVMKEPIPYLPELEGYQVSHTKNHTTFENTNFTKPLNVREENIIMFGGLDTFSSLNSLEHFDSRNVAVIFAVKILN